MKFKENKTAIVGMNGSGKTIFGMHIAKTVFRHPVIIVEGTNLDDLPKMPSNSIPILIDRREDRIGQVNEVIGHIIKTRNETGIDAIFIDEMDLYLSDNFDVKKHPNVNDIIVLQRHHRIAIFGMTRRPQSVPTKFFETADNLVIFASPQSDNVAKKLRSIHRDLPDMVRKLKKGDFKFVTHVQGEEPRLNNPIPLGKTKLKGGLKNEEN